MTSYSIRQKLSRKLSLALTITLILTVFASFLFAKYEINQLFDANLVKSAKLILGLVKHEVIEEEDPYFVIDKNFINASDRIHHYEYKLHSQAWEGDRLIYNSDENIVLQEPKENGFSNFRLNGEKWRAFVYEDSLSEIKVMTLENASARNHLIYDILLSVVLPFLICVLFVIFIIYRAIDVGLRPFGLMAEKIEKMSGQNLQEIDIAKTSRELAPFVKSFNNLVSRLKESLESERHFSDYAAHELRTPLAAIKTQAQLLQKTEDSAKRQEFLEDLISGVNRLSAMVDKLLTLARLESEKDDFAKEEISLQHFIKGLLRNWKNQILQKNISVNFEFKNEITLSTNAIYLEILLNNLLENATKYCPENGKITISGNGRTLNIANEGKPVDEKERDSIFSNFFRAKNKESQLGSGLGLAICKKIAEIYGAKISYNYENGLNVIKIKFL